MINRFEKQLEKWNNGVLRGAQAKLAKTLGVTTATVALWATSQRHPSKGYISKMAHLFRLSEYDVLRLFTSAPATATTTLREKTTTPFTTNDAGQCTLPVFTHLPPQFPFYAPQDVTGWWTLPKSTADGVAFLLECTVDKATEIWFVQPADTWHHGRLMLARKGTKLLAGEIFLKKDTHQKSFIKTEKDEPLKALIPVGVVVRRLIQAN